MRKLLAGSKLIKHRPEHLYNKKVEVDVIKEKVQEYYSVRCVPQILGPVWDTLEYAEKVFGEFSDWNSLYEQMKRQKFTSDQSSYKKFLEKAMNVFTANPEWGKPVGMPADGAKYLGGKADKVDKAEKEAGFPSFRADPAKAAANIITYSLGVGTLNQVTRGPDADEYAKMMTNIVNQSEAYLGRLDITNEGGLTSATRPFTKLKFKFQYHAPSHKPGNNLPGFMIVY
jgi:hypothetical protein